MERNNLELTKAALRILERQGLIVSRVDADGQVRLRITEKADARVRTNGCRSRFRLLEADRPPCSQPWCGKCRLAGVFNNPPSDAI